MNNIHTQKIDKLEKDNKALLYDIHTISKKYRETITKLKEEIEEIEALKKINEALKKINEHIEEENNKLKWTNNNLELDVQDYEKHLEEILNQFGVDKYINSFDGKWTGPLNEKDYAAVKAKLCNATKHNGGKRNTKRKKKK